MIGLDTNVVIRYIAQDDPVQSQKATRLIESLSSDAPGYIPLVALVEIVWVLEESYGLTKKELIVILETLLRTKELVVERAEVVARALGVFWASRAGFSDCLIERCAQAAKCEYTLTFDKAAAKSAGMRLLA